jgi:hypothetical protein
VVWQGATIDPNTGTLCWTPMQDQIGTQKVAIRLAGLYDAAPDRQTLGAGAAARRYPRGFPGRDIASTIHGVRQGV